MSHDNDDSIDYFRLVSQAKYLIIRNALFLVSEHGQIGEHYFNITFNTKYPGVNIPTYLLERYPDKMTIDLQDNFVDLEVDDAKFSVALYFNEVEETIEIPFAAIIQFSDPSVLFTLNFDDCELPDMAAFLETHIKWLRSTELEFTEKKMNSGAKDDKDLQKKKEKSALSKIAEDSKIIYLDEFRYLMPQTKERH